MKYFIFYLLLLSSYTSLASDPYPAKVVGITDGDTLKVLTADKTQVKIRLAEIDCPEKKQPWGNRAKQGLSDLTFSKMVEVQPEKLDRYGRTIGYILVDGLNVNRELVRSGHCWVYRKYMKDETLLYLETEAKDAKRGLWGLQDDQIVPPWEWRKRKKQ